MYIFKYLLQIFQGKSAGYLFLLILLVLDLLGAVVHYVSLEFKV